MPGRKIPIPNQIPPTLKDQGHGSKAKIKKAPWPQILNKMFHSSTMNPPHGRIYLRKEVIDEAINYRLCHYGFHHQTSKANSLTGER
jgi:hypothetical protein